jgi:hypothetical protein
MIVYVFSTQPLLKFFYPRAVLPTPDQTFRPDHPKCSPAGEKLLPHTEYANAYITVFTHYFSRQRERKSKI